MTVRTIPKPCGTEAIPGPRCYRVTDVIVLSQDGVYSERIGVTVRPASVSEITEKSRFNLGDLVANIHWDAGDDHSRHTTSFRPVTASELREFAALCASVADEMEAGE